MDTNWNPGLGNGDLSLGAVYNTMPKDAAESVSWYVKALENPKSPIALAGAVDLFGHDCIHCVLGRGVLPQDEAFVIGFTMGASRRLSQWQQRLFGWCSRHLYRGAYRFSDSDRKVFDHAVTVGRALKTVPLHRADFRLLLDRPLREVRTQLGIAPERLCEAYDFERQLCPDSPASARLPTLSLLPG